MKKPLVVLMLAIGMSACSDDGGSSGPEPVVHAQPTGIWRGCLTTILEWEYKGEPEYEDFTCQDPLGAGQHPMLVVADSQRRFRVFSEFGVVHSYDADSSHREWTTAPFLALGQVTTRENASMGHWGIFSVNPETDLPPSLETLQYRKATSKGEMVTAESWRGTISWENLDYFKFDLAYDEAESQRGASLTRLEGIWQNADDEAEPLTIQFHSDGRFETDVNASGNCLYQGTVSVPDRAQNLYRLTGVTVDHSPSGRCFGKKPQDFLRGDYGGVAVLVEENGIDVLKIMLTHEFRLLNLNLRSN